MSQPPQYSPDGRWWWDGQRWVPVAPATGSGGPIHVRPHAAPWRFVFWAVLIGGIVLVIAWGILSAPK